MACGEAKQRAARPLSLAGQELVIASSALAIIHALFMEAAELLMLLRDKVHSK